MGDLTGNLKASPSTYTGPVSGLVLSQPEGALADAYGNLYILDHGGSFLRVVASGKGPIPSLPSVPNPQADTVYPLAGQGDTGCANPADSEGDGCVATQSIFSTSFWVGVALDLNGNVYIADDINGLVRVVYAGGSVPGLSNLTPGYIYAVAGNGGGGDGAPAIDAYVNPSGLGVDTHGNVYITDANDGYIQVIYSGGSVASDSTGDLPANPVIGDIYTILSNGNYGPGSIAVDVYGNVFFGDTIYNQVGAIYASGTLPGIPNPVAGQTYLIAGNGGNTSTPQNGIPATTAAVGQPYHIAFDSMGNLYIPDSNDGYVFRVDSTGNLTTVFGTTQPGCAIGATDLLGDGCTGTQSSLNTPYSVAFGPTNDMFVADKGLNREPPYLVRELNPETSVLSFITPAVGTTSAMQSVTVTNAGTSPLLMSNIAVSSQFAQVPSGGTDCSTAQSIAPAAFCEIGIVFEPTVAGTPNGAVTVSSNAANATNDVNVITLHGEAGTPVTIGVAATPSSPGAYQNVTITATVSPTSGTATPTGTVTFQAGSTTYGTVTLTNGVASITTNQLAYGNDMIEALYSGDTVYSGEFTISKYDYQLWRPVDRHPIHGHPNVGTEPNRHADSHADRRPRAIQCQFDMLAICAGSYMQSWNLNGGVPKGSPPHQCKCRTLTAAPVTSAQESKEPARGNPFSLALIVPGLFGLLGLSQRRRLKLGLTVQGGILAFVMLSGAFCLTSCSSGAGGTTTRQPVQQTVTINAIFPGPAYVSTTSFQVTVQ